MKTNSKVNKLSRRRFLRDSAAAGSVLFGAPAILKSAAPNSMLQVACIGVGGMGGSTMKGVASHAKVKTTALCDVAEQTLNLAAKTFTDASRHRDWREMLSGHADKFDAVTIGTPDHMHAVVAAKAMKMCKHVHCQKPLTHTIWEARQLGKIAKE